VSGAAGGAILLASTFDELGLSNQEHVMSTASGPLSGPPEFTVEELRKHWGLIAGFGAGLIVLGVLLLSSYPFMVLGALGLVYFIGVLILLSGAAQIANAIIIRAWGGFFLFLLTGILDILIGIFFLRKPDAAADVLVFLLAAYFLVGGLFRILIAAVRRFPHRLWLFATGAVAVLLGILLFSGLSQSGDILFSEMVLGTFLGIKVLFNGVSVLMLGLAARKAAPAV
jgi:uncharacterized membrane protein HdeD (DUF308 family)